MKKRILSGLIIISLCFSLCSCRTEKSVSSRDVKILKDLIYENNETSVYRVYLEENNQYVPFIVLSCANYKGCLLLREHLLDENVNYNNAQEYASYYKDSNIDNYLNNVGKWAGNASSDTIQGVRCKR